ncbi:hypothetical protein GCM10011578_056750 [Streptomyces fuscichromogenes]|uniref:Uncharacterized protein n=1 Tax=Streptomyces fuscichromogenes TaxID=1324013 RepID=A0A917XGS5_9ACTN|nr:hypothetical protein GCM10011578_056750 [Streptomyces fuscichromogenes]
MSVSQSEERRPVTVVGVSMRELLASCAAADAVSRPPRAPEPASRPVVQDRRAA